MAYSGSQAPLPPPPPVSGNRNTMRTVGGATSNFAYGDGANLQQARTLYQQGLAGTKFHNAPPVNAPGADDLSQMASQSLGQVRNPNSDHGHGYGRLASGPMRQHTIYAQDGQEWGSNNMAVVKRPVTPPPPPVAPPVTPPTQMSPGAPNPNAPVPGPGVDGRTVPIENTGTAPTPPAGSGIGAAPTQTTAPVGYDALQAKAEASQTVRQTYAGKWKPGSYIKASDGRTFQVVSGSYIGGVYTPIVRQPDGSGTMVHPDWRSF